MIHQPSKILKLVNLYCGQTFTKECLFIQLTEEEVKSLGIKKKENVLSLEEEFEVSFCHT